MEEQWTNIFSIWAQDDHFSQTINDLIPSVIGTKKTLLNFETFFNFAAMITEIKFLQESSLVAGTFMADTDVTLQIITK